MNRREFLKSTALAAAATSRAVWADSDAAPLSEFDYDSVQFEPGLQQSQLEQTHAVLMELSEDSMLRPFRVREGLPAPGVDLGGWYDTYAFAPAHSYGQWMSALARYYAIRKDEPTRGKVSRLVRGYAVTMDPAGRFFQHNRFPAYLYDKLVCGLIDAHKFAHDPDALPILGQATDVVFPHLPGKAVPHMTRELTEEEQYSLHGWDESYTMPENLFLAAERSGEDRYRKMARTYLMDDSYFDPLAAGENVLAGRHAYSHVNALCSAAKAYLALGDQKYLRAGQNGFRFVEAQSFATGGWGPDELFYPPGSGQPGESLQKTHAGFETPCGAYAHFKLTRYLIRITKDAHYGDSMERVMYNTVLGAKPLQSNGSTFYYSDYRPGGRKTYHPDKWPCCSGTLPQIAADYQISTYFRDSSGVFVNLYIPSTLRWKQGDTQATLSQSGEYPRKPFVQLTVNTPKPVDCNIRLRIPAWTADKASVSINGKRVQAEMKGGTFAGLARTWRDGDRIELELPLTTRLEPVDAQHLDLVALVQGPLVLFPLGDVEPKITRKELLSHNWRGIRFLPFTDIHDETYSTYINVAPSPVRS